MASLLETNEHNKTTMLAALIDQNQPIGEEKGKVHGRVMSRVPLWVWASSSKDIGSIKTAEPAHMLLKQNAPCQRSCSIPSLKKRVEAFIP